MRRTWLRFGCWRCILTAEEMAIFVLNRMRKLPNRHLAERVNFSTQLRQIGNRGCFRLWHPMRIGLFPIVGGRKMGVKICPRVAALAPHPIRESPVQGAWRHPQDADMRRNLFRYQRLRAAWRKGKLPIALELRKTQFLPTSSNHHPHTNTRFASPVVR